MVSFSRVANVGRGRVRLNGDGGEIMAGVRERRPGGEVFSRVANVGRGRVA